MPTFTTKAIKTAFLVLLEKQPLSKITVKNIVDECGINRNSFYYHFQDIPTLLEEVIKDEADYLINALPPTFTLEDSISCILNRIEEEKKIVSNIWHSSNREMYELHLMTICEYVARKYVENKKSTIHLSEKEADFYIDFLKCEFFGLIINWIHENMSYSISSYTLELCENMRRILQILCKNEDKSAG